MKRRVVKTPKRNESNSDDWLQTLARLGADPMSGVHLRPGCGSTAIRQLQAAAKRDLGEEVPAAFVRLLRLTNGVQINGTYFKEAENLVSENLDVDLAGVIILGNDGSTAQYVFDKRDRQFHTINMGFPDERFASYPTFEDLLLAVLREQQVL
jgi:hypothetical protein